MFFVYPVMVICRINWMPRSGGMPNNQMKTVLDSIKHDAYFALGFSFTRKAWRRFRVSELVPGIESTGKRLRGPDAVHTFRLLAAEMNAYRFKKTQQAEPVSAGQLFAFNLLSEIFRYVANKYCLIDFPGVLLNGMNTIRAQHGAALVEKPTRTFVDLFPPCQVLTGAQTPETYLVSVEQDVPNPYRTTREVLLLQLARINPATKTFAELFDATELAQLAPYEDFATALDHFLAKQPPVPGGGNKTLLEFLRMPILAAPDSLESQLAYILQQWTALLPEELLEQIQLAAGVIQEETRMRGWGPGPAEVLHFGDHEFLHDYAYPEPAAFTIDQDWMSNVVLLAKTVYVWLDQLSRVYERPITRLDQVPDEELDTLSRWGFTGLWLIGLWERSPASQGIKQRMGNPEAIASAYSLFDYEIAKDLGGEEAYHNLRDRASQRGIRLASDMVPNHVGLYSRWIVEHPDWFLQQRHSPYPAYQFNGPNLSEDDRVALFIEDGYWDCRDAAVVFKRVDSWTGDTRYIYHGNDGTNTPWNDTAQLNFLLPEVREAVIQTILHVARLFPIIRFDAAMTLAKRHFQRLWFPKPGDAGAVPSRAEHGMTRDAFDAVFPKEFWREVVDRIQQEVPDTLLLAEAFWLMEGYFVRTLGMHRVYNSAFMNMLKMEENSKYRMTIKNVLEFSPEILNRFVNFMNNPDERTAVEQFGKGDKYYGVAMMMVTMPGLPMFGHGQIQGFTEKYGMEYRKAYWDEQVDTHMITRHEVEIFPLMRKRRLFSGAQNFALFDAVTPDGWVDENVFAYSNRADGERALILFNNAYNTAQGHVRMSTAINVGDAEHKNLVRKSLAEALDLEDRDDTYYAFRDHRTKLEYLRPAPLLAREGIRFMLHAYTYHAFLDWRAIRDTDGTWARLYASLNSEGVPSVDDAYREMILEPIHGPFRQIMNVKMLQAFVAPCLTQQSGPVRTRKLRALSPEVQALLEEAMHAFTAAIQRHSSLNISADGLIDTLARELEFLYDFSASIKRLKLLKKMADQLLDPIPTEETSVTIRERFWRIPVALTLTHQVVRIHAADRYTGLDNVADEWMLTKIVGEVFADIASAEVSSQAEISALAENTASNSDTASKNVATVKAAKEIAASDVPAKKTRKKAAKTAPIVEAVYSEQAALLDALLVKILMSHPTAMDFYPRGAGVYAIRRLMEDPTVQRYLFMNRYNGHLWVNKEQLESLVYWILFEATIALQLAGHLTKETLATRCANATEILTAALAAGYNVDMMFQILQCEP